MNRREFLGAGVGLRQAHIDALLDGEPRQPPVLELLPSQFFFEPARLEAVAEGRAIVLHDVFASLGTAAPLDHGHLDRVAEVARRSGALAYTEHLAMTRSPGGLDLGHLIPLRRTRAQLELLVDRVRAVQDRLGLPVALELPTTTLVFAEAAEAAGAEALMSEGEFLAALVDACACELVLDLENLRVDAHNWASLPVDPRVAALPLAAVSHLHLAGGHRRGAWAIDSHAAPVPEANFALLAQLRGRINPRTIIVERDAQLPAWAELLGEARRAEAIWRGL